ncbi:hypothetical protein WCLP8_2150002 [uncultured Gammaproteobacteria bacterium]
MCRAIVARLRCGYGNFGSQNSVGTIDGFDTATGGMAVGADTRVNDNIRIGVAFNYSATGISQTGTRNGDKTDIDSYGGTLYGSYTGNPWYVDGMFNYTRHQYKDQRSVAFTGFSDALSANYGADQFTVRSDAGYPLQVGSPVPATPVLNRTYTNARTAAYPESGGPARMIYASPTSLPTNSVECLVHPPPTPLPPRRRQQRLCRWAGTTMKMKSPSPTKMRRRKTTAA